MQDIEAQASPNTLTESEAKQLAAEEAVIERGLTTFFEVGDALARIRSAKLYRATHARFDDYTKERWGFTDSRARQLILAARTVTDVTAAGLPVPENEAQAREVRRQTRNGTNSTSTTPAQRDWLRKMLQFNKYVPYIPRDATDAELAQAKAVAASLRKAARSLDKEIASVQKSRSDSSQMALV